jgi:ABC-2 type transport system permease protein
MNAAMIWHRTAAIAGKELAQIKRDHAMLRIIIVMPLMLLILFGYAINTTVKDIRLAVFDQSNDRMSHALLDAFKAHDRFEAIPAEGQSAMFDAVRSGQARAGLQIPAGALAKARAEEAIPFTVYVDGSDPTVAAQIRAGVATASQELVEQIMAGRALANPGMSAPLSPTIETLYNPQDRTAVYMVPGIIGIILTQVTILLTAIAIVRERETGTMEGLIATPVRPVEVVVGKTLPYLLIGLLDAAIIVGVGVWHFQVPFVGSLWLLIAAILLFVLGSLGLGILISTLARQQIHAMLGTMAYLLPSIFLSGLLFPVEGFNAFFDGVSHLVPLRYFLQIARGVMLRGAGLESLWPQFGALCIFAVVVLGLASLRFRKTL